MAGEKKKEAEDWIQKKWRPMMAIMYMVVCIFDFIIFPVMFTIVQFWETQAANDAFRQWQPLTLVGAGLFHMAMGAVLGITAWSRGQEKMAGVATNLGANLNGFNSPTSMPTAYGQPAAGGYMSSTNFNYAGPQSTSSSEFSTQEYSRETMSIQPIIEYKGKKAPIQPPDPEI